MPRPSQHPVKRIRESFMTLSEESGMRNYANTAKFARWLGRSESLIRNVENGNASLSRQLARLIESKTGVSAEWLRQGVIADDGVIMANNGLPWKPAKYLDPYARSGLLSHFKLFLDSKPELITTLVGAMVEARIKMELTRGGRMPEKEMMMRATDWDLPPFESFNVLRKVLMAVQLDDESDKQEFEHYLWEVLDKKPAAEDLKAVWRVISMMAVEKRFD